MANYLTQTDVENYGSDLVDFAQRAAAHAVAPQIQNLQQQNAELHERLAKESRRGLDARVAAALPNYREIDRDPNWHNWLLQTDSLSGIQRQMLLNDAIANSDAVRVVSFFRQFMRENGTGGQTSAAPARSSGKPVYTRAQIAELYSRHRKGAYAGREAEWARQEEDIFAAGREGRILSFDYISK
jgi:hypothetical protein